MLKLNKVYLFVLLSCGVLAAFPLSMPTAFHIDESKSPLFETFPMDLGSWKGTDDVVDERTYEILETRNVLSRTFENPDGRKINLLIVGSFKDRRVAHPPEVCYLSSNYIIVDEKDDAVAIDGGIHVKTFLAKNERNPDHQEKVVYLYKVGNRFTTSYYSQQLQFALDRLAKRESQVLLIRLSVPKQGGFTESEAFKGVLEEFLSQVLKQI